MLTSLKPSASKPVKARMPELTCDVSTITAFNTVAASLLAQIEANRQGVIEGRDVEYLHQMRVAVRRLRSLCAAYAKRLPQAALLPWIEQLKWLARALGPARDADVFVSEIWPPLRAMLKANPLLATLDARWVAQQRTAAAKARRAPGARRYQRFMLGGRRWLADESWREDASEQQLAVLDAAARDFACQVLAHRDARVRRHGHTLRRLDGAQLHALRIRVKKLRYLADSFGSLFERNSLHDSLTHLSRLQDVLGGLNDIRVAEQQLAAALLHRRGRAVSELRVALAAWREARTAALRHELRAAWREYRHAKQFWALRQPRHSFAAADL